MTPNNMRESRKLRIELILLGMVLARDGDKERILEKISPYDLQSDHVINCIEAIRDKDNERLKETFRAFGCDLQGSLSDSLLRHIECCALKQKVLDTLSHITCTRAVDDLSKLKETLESTVSEIRNYEEVR